MFSRLRTGLLYPVSTDVVEHDLDIDADQWSYNDRDVYRGSLDSKYLKDDLNVYWLYDDNSMRVGLVEHETKSPEVFQALWFYDNPFATLLQDESWKSEEKTLWSKLSNEAYQDCLENDFKDVADMALNSGILLVTPQRLIEKPKIYKCEICNKKSLTQRCPNSMVSNEEYSILFVDEDFVIYSKQPSDASAEVLQEEQTPSADQEA
jgi:hypothetical protein